MKLLPRMIFDNGEIQSKEFTVMILLKMVFIGFMFGFIVSGYVQ